MQDDGERLSQSLAAWLGRLSFTDLDADQTGALLTDSVVAWGTAAGWRVYRRARSVATLPPPYEDRHSWVDVACARADGPPIVVEIDRTDRRRTVDKLLAEARAGRVALWVRWSVAPITSTPEPPVHLVPVLVESRKDGGRRLFSSPSPERPAPPHSDLDLDLTAAEQTDLFAGPGSSPRDSGR